MGRERKMKAKARKLEQGQADDVEAEVDNEAQELGHTKGKRKKQKAAEKTTAVEEIPADRGPTKKKNKRIKSESQPLAENAERELASHKSKKRRSETKNSGEADVHPSWNAAKKKEKSGALVKGA